MQNSKTAMMAMNLALIVATLSVAAPASVAPRLEIISVRPNKIVYEDGEAGRAKVRLYNPLEQSFTVLLKPELRWDLGESRSLEPVKVTVEPGGHAVAEVVWDAPGERWGHEIRVSAVVDEATVDVGRQFFGVSSEWMKLILISTLATCTLAMRLCTLA